MTIEFKLATQASGEGGLTLLGALTPPVLSCNPVATYQPAQEVEQLGDGSTLAVGGPSADWLLPLITPAEYAVLQTYAGWCYLRTIDDQGSYANYLGFLAWPVSPPRIRAGLMYDLVLHFVSLVKQAAP